MEKHVNREAEVSHHIFPADKYWPNNNDLPVLVYKAVFNLEANEGADLIQKHFEQNGWSNSWKDSVYQYQHYHSNAHEVLGVSRGNIMLQLGGEDGTISTLCKGDVIVIPAGVVHKNVGCSEDFECVGAYPGGKDYDINTGKPEEREKAEQNIGSLDTPATDPVLGTAGPIFQYWKKDHSKKVLETARQF